MSWCWGSILGEHLGNIRLGRLFAQRPGCWFRRLLLIEIQGRHLSGDRCDRVGHDVGGIARLLVAGRTRRIVTRRWFNLQFRSPTRSGHMPLFPRLLIPPYHTIRPELEIHNRFKRFHMAHNSQPSHGNECLKHKYEIRAFSPTLQGSRVASAASVHAYIYTCRSLPCFQNHLRERFPSFVFPSLPRLGFWLK